jgi:hypothetical protein
MMPDENGLTERDGVGDCGNGRVCPVGLGGALVAVVLETVGPLLGACDERGS